MFMKAVAVSTDTTDLFFMTITVAAVDETGL